MMHKVKRSEEPKSLKENKEVWTDELLEQIRIKGSYSKVEDKYKNRYKHDDVKIALETMYSGLCCFCESKIGVSSFDRIEHLKPKALSQFHHLSFEWTNLNLCCEVCNNKKSDNWDDKNPILDPCEDKPEEHLLYKYDMIEAKTERGRTTIDHTDLNRSALVKARSEILARAMRIIEDIYYEGDGNKKQRLKCELMNIVHEGEEYCSFIKHIVNRYCT